MTITTLHVGLPLPNQMNETFLLEENIATYNSHCCLFIVAMVYCKPALQGEVLEQKIYPLEWHGTDAFNYKEQHGHYPLWNTHFSVACLITRCMEVKVSY